MSIFNATEPDIFIAGVPDHPNKRQLAEDLKNTIVEYSKRNRFERTLGFIQFIKLSDNAEVPFAHMGLQNRCNHVRVVELLGGNVQFRGNTLIFTLGNRMPSRKSQIPSGSEFINEPFGYTTPRYFHAPALQPSASKRPREDSPEPIHIKQEASSDKQSEFAYVQAELNNLKQRVAQLEEEKIRKNQLKNQLAPLIAKLPAIEKFIDDELTASQTVRAIDQHLHPQADTEQ